MQAPHVLSVAYTRLFRMNLEGSMLQSWQWLFQSGDAQGLQGLLRSFSQSTAPGNDGLPVAVFLSFPLNLLDAMATSFRRVVEGQLQYPSAWREPCVRLLPKTVQAIAPSDFRPISVNSIGQRLYSKWIYNITKQVTVTHPSKIRQLAAAGGACAGIELICMGWQLAMLKVDIKKAYDTLEPETMLAAMQPKGISRGLELAILDLHGRRSPCYHLYGLASSPTELQKGVAQGDPTSAWLFRSA